MDMQNEDKDCKSLKSLLSIGEYRKFLKSLDNILINKNNSLIEIVENVINNGECLFECGICSNHTYGIGILIPADWETKTINKKSSKLLICYGSDYATTYAILSQIHQWLPKDMFWVQCDSQLSEPHVEIALEKFGYHIGTQYYQWVCQAGIINQSKINFSDRFDIESATRDDAEEIRELIEKFPEPGRFVTDPFLKEEGKRLYAAWGYNSCIDISDKNHVLIYKLNGKIIGYITIKFLSDGEADLGILRIDSKYKGRYVGYALLCAAIKECIYRGVEVIKTRTSKFNVAVNNIYKNLGFSLVDSGIQFHWIREDKGNSEVR